MKRGVREVNWHAVVDGFAVEVVSTFVVCYSVLVSWCEVGYLPPNDWAAEFIPALAMALSIACVRDKDGVFADTSPFVTLIEAYIGAYESGVEIASRVAGQLVGAAVAMLLSCVTGAGVADMTERHVMPSGGLVVFSAASTSLTLIAVLYVVVPLLGPKPAGGATARAAGVTLAMAHWITWRYLQLSQKLLQRDALRPPDAFHMPTGCCAWNRTRTSRWRWGLRGRGSTRWSTCGLRSGTCYWGSAWARARPSGTPASSGCAIVVGRRCGAYIRERAVGAQGRHGCSGMGGET
jgi:hypothetical protein